MIASLALFMVLSSACTWLRDQRKPPVSFKNGPLNLSCLKSTSENLGDLFKGKLGSSKEDQEKIEGSWNCLDRALGAFSDFTRGKTFGEYEAKELQLFANQFLGETQRIDDSFAESIFKLKTAVLGGSEDKLTREEIKNLRRNIGRFGKAILPLAPQIKVLLNTRDFNAVERDEALAQLNIFTQELADIFGGSLHPMSWTVLAGFALDLEKHLKADGVTALTMIYEQKDLLRFIKQLLVGGSSEVIEPEKWNPILSGLTSTVGTLMTATNSLDVVENFKFKFSSTAAEQKSAFDQLGLVLKELLKHPELRTSFRIKEIADYWIKIRLVIEVLLSSSPEPISLNVFLEDPKLRTAENTFAKGVVSQKALKVEKSNLPSQLSALRELLVQFDRTLTAKVKKRQSFSLKKLQEVHEAYLDFYFDPSLSKTIPRGIKIFRAVHDLITKKSGDEVFLSDFDPVIQKVIQVLKEAPDQTLPFREQLNAWVKILKIAPAINEIRRTDLESFLPELIPSIEEATLKAWSSLFFELKNGLFGSDPKVLSLSDVENALFLFDQKDLATQDPTGLLLILSKKFRQGGVEPFVRLSWIPRLISTPLPDQEKVKAFQARLVSLSGQMETFKVIRKILNGKTDDRVTLSEISELLEQIQGIRNCALGGDPGVDRVRWILNELLNGPKDLVITSGDLEVLFKATETLTGKPLPVDRSLVAKVLGIKHQVFGTDPKGLERLDLEWASALLDLKGTPLEKLQAFLNQLEGKGLIGKSEVNLDDVSALLRDLKANPEVKADLTLYLNLIRDFLDFKKVFLSDPSPVLPLAKVQSLLKDYQQTRDLAFGKKVEFWLEWFLRSSSLKALSLKDLNELILKVTATASELTGKLIDSRSYLKSLEDGFKLKSTLFHSSAESMTREELELALRALQIENSSLNQSKKAKAFGDLIRKNLKKSIQISDLVRDLKPILKDFNLEHKIPIPLKVSTVKRLKILTIGGDPNSLKPSEIADLIQKVAKGGEAKDLLNKPKFKLDSETFIWLEAAIGLGIDLKKEIGLKNALISIEKYFEESGFNLKYPLDRSLYGIWYHVLQGKKGLLPASVVRANFEVDDESRIETHHLEAINGLIHSIRLKLKDLERAYQGSGTRVAALSRGDLLARLKDPDNRHLVQTFRPTLKVAQDQVMLHLSAVQAQQGRFEYMELAYQAVILQTVKYLFKQYNARGGQDSLNSEEFAVLLDDLRIPMIDFGLLYKSGNPIEVAQKQMKTINLFTRTGNGNTLIEVDEAIEFMTLSYGTGSTFKRLITHLSSHCPKKQVEGLDAFDGQCVVKYLFQPGIYQSLYGASLPGMAAAYQSLSSSERPIFELGTLKLTGKNLFHEKKRGWFDHFTDRTMSDYQYVSFDLDMLQSINAVHPLIETVFETMDSSHDGGIQLKEALAMFPKFCPAIYSAAKAKVKGSCDSQKSWGDLYLLYGYLLVHKEKPGIGFYFWDHTWKDYLSGENPFQALTRFDLFKILSNLSP